MGGGQTALGRPRDPPGPGPVEEPLLGGLDGAETPRRAGLGQGEPFLGQGEVVTPGLPADQEDADLRCPEGPGGHLGRRPFPQGAEGGVGPPVGPGHHVPEPLEGVDGPGEARPAPGCLFDPLSRGLGLQNSPFGEFQVGLRDPDRRPGIPDGPEKHGPGVNPPDRGVVGGAAVGDGAGGNPEEPPLLGAQIDSGRGEPRPDLPGVGGPLGPAEGQGSSGVGVPDLSARPHPVPPKVCPGVGVRRPR